MSESAPQQSVTKVLVMMPAVISVKYHTGQLFGNKKLDLNRKA